VAQIAFVRRGFNLSVGHGRDYDLHRAKRTGDHTGFATNAFLLIHLYAVVAFSNRPIGAAFRAGGVFAVMAGDRAAPFPLFQHRNARDKLALA
jgi:hypothetical protein